MRSFPSIFIFSLFCYRLCDHNLSILLFWYWVPKFGSPSWIYWVGLMLGFVCLLSLPQERPSCASQERRLSRSYEITRIKTDSVNRPLQNWKSNSNHIKTPKYTYSTWKGTVGICQTTFKSYRKFYIARTNYVLDFKIHFTRCKYQSNSFRFS